MDKKGRCLQCQHFCNLRGPIGRGICNSIGKEIRISFGKGSIWRYPDEIEISELFRCIYYRRKKDNGEKANSGKAGK